MSLYKPVPGAPDCVCCFERNCFGCALTAQAIGLCPICGRDILLDDFYEWQGDDLVHWDCLNEFEGVEER